MACAVKYDPRLRHGRDLAGAIIPVVRCAISHALNAIQMLGGNGYISDEPTGRLGRDGGLYEIGAGAGEIRRWRIGRELFEETA